MVERWNGTSWTIASSPNPSGAPSSQLAGLSCTSTTNCFAVGNYNISGTIRTLVEQWNGTSWTIVASPNPSGASQSYLSGVSCTTGTDCAAAGYYFNSGAFVGRTLIERYS